MEGLMPVDVLSRWLHVGFAIVLVGGSIYTRFVLMPAAAQLPQAEHDALRQALMGRWRKIVGIGIGLLLLSGFYNFIRAVTTRELPAPYHALMGIKILLAFAVFFLASALSGRSPTFEGLRQNSKKWLAVTVVLSVIIVAIAGYLKVAGSEPKQAAAAPPTAEIAD